MNFHFVMTAGDVFGFAVLGLIVLAAIVYSVWWVIDDWLAGRRRKRDK